MAADDFSIANYRGKVLLLNFWATWCKPCIHEIPDLIKLRKQFDSSDVAVVGVALDRGKDPSATRAKVKGFIDKYHINYPIVLDDEWRLVRGYFKMEAVPMTFIIDQSGEIYRAHRGLPTDEDGRVDPVGIYGEDISALLGQG